MRQKNGQNFLIDNNIAAKIIKAADLEPTDNVLEIGSGKGVLTKLIQPKVNKLTAVEIDEMLSQRLRHYFSFKKVTNVDLINQNFLEYDVADIKCKFISNLPYNVGTAILQKIMPLQNWTSAVFMLQKEVVARLAAKPGNKDYGYISIFTSYYADAQVLFDVSPKCFDPPPKVVSSVVKLTSKNSKMPDFVFFDFVKHAFSMRRKTILNCFSSFCNVPKDKALSILDNCGLNALSRPDKLSIFDFLNLTKKIEKNRIYRAEF